MKNLIITADDYGMCTFVDKAIDDCIISGAVSSTNVIVNLETFENSNTLRTRFPHVSIGIHWNLTTGKPVSDPLLVPTLIDENGFFFPVNEFKKRLGNGSIKKQEVIFELTNQYNKFYESCGKPDYWNTHENSALTLQAFRIFAKTALNLGISKTRNFQRVYIDIKSISFRRKLREMVMALASNIWFGIIVKRSFSMPDARLFPFNLSSKFNIDLLVDSVNRSKKNIIEVVVHPSINASHKYFGLISNERVEEYNFLCNSNLTDIFQSNEIVISNFDIFGDKQ